VRWNLRYWCEVDEEKPGVDSRDEVRRTEKKDLLFVEKITRALYTGLNKQYGCC